MGTPSGSAGGLQDLKFVELKGIGQNKTFERKEEPPLLLRLRLSRRYPGLFWDQIRPLKVVPTPEKAMFSSSNAFC